MKENLPNITVSDLAQHLNATIIESSHTSKHDTTSAITSIEYQSNKCLDGSVFCAIEGFKSDGHKYIADAVAHGAQAVVVTKEVEDPGVSVLLVKDGRKAMAKAAELFYDFPYKKMKMIALTGTNGKTTGVSLAAHIARVMGHKAATIGTLGAQFEEDSIQTHNTTPESVDIQHLLYEALIRGTEVLAMEASSHALALDRTYGISYDIAAFTNLTSEHLDFHKDMQDYFEAKAKLFWDYDVKNRVICIDDDWGKKLAQGCADRGFSYLSVGRSPEADLHPSSIELSPNGTHLELEEPSGTISLHVPLVGSFNVQNTLVAAGIAYQMGLSSEEIAHALEHTKQVPGRLERVGKEYKQHVFVDYAHTADALEKAMQAVSETGPKRMIVVFGCGGDRDRTKRAPMGKVAAHADIAICTSDNPRTEDPLAIIEEIKLGLEGEAQKTGAVIHYEPDRKQAIALAVKLALPGDAVLIAGKGHEDYQILAHETIHLDDREEAAKALELYGEK